MGDEISHAVVPSVVITYALEIPFTVGAFLFSFGATVVLLGPQSRQGQVSPGATAHLQSDRFDHIVMISVATRVASCVLGTYMSYHLDTSTAGSIVVPLTLLFGITMVFPPKYAILSQSRQKHLYATATISPRNPDITP